MGGDRPSGVVMSQLPWTRGHALLPRRNSNDPGIIPVPEPGVALGLAAGALLLAVIGRRRSS